MVYNGKPYEQMDDLGVPLFLETPISKPSPFFLRPPESSKSFEATIAPRTHEEPKTTRPHLGGGFNPFEKY